MDWYSAFRSRSWHGASCLEARFSSWHNPLMSETDIMRRIMLGVTGNEVKLFRNNSGAFKDKSGRWTKFGVGIGGSDLIGLKSIVVHPSMIGSRLAVFCAVEVKSETGRMTPEQQHFLDVILAAGGLAGIARSVADAELILGRLP